MTNPKISLEVVRYFLNRIDTEEAEEIEREEDEITRTIRYAFHFTTQYPNKVMIFTSNDKIEEYKKNEHYEEIKSIKVINGDDAISIIEYWFNKCREEVRTSCN